MRPGPSRPPPRCDQSVVSSGSGSRAGAVEGDEGVEGDDEPSAPAELLGDRRSDPAPAAGHDGDPLPPAHDAVDRASSVEALEGVRLRATARATRGRRRSRPSRGRSCRCGGFMRFGVSLVVEARRGAGRHHRALVDEGVDHLLRPRLSSASALTSKTSTPRCSSRPTAAPMNSAPSVGQLGSSSPSPPPVGLGAGMSEQVREATAHDPEQAGGRSVRPTSRPG